MFPSAPPHIIFNVGWSGAETETNTRHNMDASIFRSSPPHIIINVGRAVTKMENKTRHLHAAKDDNSNKTIHLALRRRHASEGELFHCIERKSYTTRSYLPDRTHALNPNSDDDDLRWVLLPHTARRGIEIVWRRLNAIGHHPLHRHRGGQQLAIVIAWENV